jgi:hypothetical protein
MNISLTRGSFLATVCAGAILLAGGCTTTQYGHTDVSKLSDEQLIAELTSVERELGIQSDYRSALFAIDTSPRPVVTSASTAYSGNFNAQYNTANQTLNGNFNGNGYTTYQYMDANGGARFGQALALIINASKTGKLENRHNAVLTEISHRREARQNMERITGQFLAAHLDIAANRDLLIACLLITQHQSADPLEQLQQAAEIIHSLPKDRWVGWVEAHGDPRYPYGVVVGSYVMDTSWNGDTLVGKGKASDGSEMMLTAKKKQDGTIDGTIQSQTMQAQFTGRMTDFALWVDYTGTEGGQPIRGITWAHRRAEVNNLQSVPVSVAQTQSNGFSGRYVGNGRSANNGVEQPYQIILDISNSGAVTFACTAVVNNKPVVVTGKGMVDSDGNVTVQNQYGNTGHGTIKGNLLKAGGESADGSIKSYFTAQKEN